MSDAPDYRAECSPGSLCSEAQGARQQPRAGGIPRPELTLLYRGPLASCDADCAYCPFAKRRDSPEQLRVDRRALERFVAWAEANPQRHARLNVQFTPWGEALVRSWYREAIVRLSRHPHVGKVVVQTNLRSRLGWLRAADSAKVGFWATYHPGQIPGERFLAHCAELRALGIEHSVGIVGLPEHLEEARTLRAALPPETYLWVNAADGHGYTEVEEQAWAQLDPFFAASLMPHPSAGQRCRAGDTVVSVDGEGRVLPCHFDARELGNLYDGSYAGGLGSGTCGLDACDCHIGYVHLPSTGLYDVFGGPDAGALSRVPSGWPRVMTSTSSQAAAPTGCGSSPNVGVTTQRAELGLPDMPGRRRRTPRSVPTANRPI